MNTTTIRLRESELRWSEHDGEVVVRDERRSMSYTLNHSAALLWVRLAEGAGIPELVEALADEYDVDIDTAQQDVDRFVIALEDYSLLDSE
jgi:hypothetical protein